MIWSLSRATTGFNPEGWKRLQMIEVASSPSIGQSEVDPACRRQFRHCPAGGFSSEGRYGEGCLGRDRAAASCAPCQRACRRSSIAQGVGRLACHRRPHAPFGRWSMTTLSRMTYEHLQIDQQDDLKGEWWRCNPSTAVLNQLTSLLMEAKGCNRSPDLINGSIRADPMARGSAWLATA